jgi:hypothetical protein
VTRKARLIGVGNKMLGYAPYYIGTTVLDHDHEFILQLIDFYRKKHETA